MRGVAIGVILVLLVFAVPPASAGKEDFTGSVTFRDGTVSTYTWLAVRHDEIPSARDVSDMQHEEALSVLSARGLFIETWCDTEHEARDLLRAVERWSKA